jgi:hypothetical protein
VKDQPADACPDLQTRAKPMMRIAVIVDPVFHPSADILLVLERASSRRMIDGIQGSFVKAVVQ